jgi:hypothetical protein
MKQYLINGCLPSCSRSSLHRSELVSCRVARLIPFHVKRVGWPIDEVILNAIALRHNSKNLFSTKG